MGQGHDGNFKDVVIQIKRNTSAAWGFANPVLAQGEAGYELDLRGLKFGDGVNPWSSLPYFGGGGGGTGTVTSVNATISGALGVSGGPITTAGTLNFAWQGNSSQYVLGDGSLASIISISAGPEIDISSSVVSFKGGQRYNVLDYGLIGDGSTDNRNALNALLNTTAPSGSVIYFPKGKYNFNSTISTNNRWFSFISDLSEIHVTFDGELFNIQSSNTSDTSRNWTIENLLFTGNSNGANQLGFLFFTDWASFVFSNCVFRNFGNSLNSSGITIAKSGSPAFRTAGIISNCRFYDNYICIDLALRAEYVIITGCDIVNNTYGIRSNSGNMSITNNNINVNTYGIFCFSGPNNSHSIISNNQINHNTGYALHLENCPLGFTLASNHIYDGNIDIINSNGVSFIGGIQDANIYTITNSVVVFQNVEFVGTLGTQVITGGNPVYNNCYKQTGEGAQNPNTFISNRTALTTSVGYLTGLQFVDGNQALNKVMSSDASGNVSWQLLPSLSGYVPYTGANQTVDLNTQNLIAGSGLFGGIANTGMKSLRAGTSSFVDIGSNGTGGFAGFWVNQTSPSSANFSFLSDGNTGNYFNVPSSNGAQAFRFGNTIQMVTMQGPQTSGVANNFLLSSISNTGMSAGQDISGVKFNMPNNQWLTGGITIARGFAINSGTWSSVGTSVMDDGYGFWVSAPSTSGPLSITRLWAAGFNGRVDISGSMRIVDGTQANGYVLTSDANGNTSWQASAGGSSSLTSTQIAFGSSSNLMTSNPSLTFNPALIGNMPLMVDNVRIGTDAIGCAIDLTGFSLATIKHGFNSIMSNTSSQFLRLIVNSVKSAEFGTSYASIGTSGNMLWDESNLLLYVGGNTGAFTNTKLQIYDNINNFSQSNYQNLNSGTSASSDSVWTADTGTNTTNYLNAGINSSTYSDVTFTIGTFLDAYLYANGGNLLLGSQSSKDIVFFTGGTLLANEIARFKNGSGLKLSGSFQVPYTAQTSTYAILATDYTINCTSGTFTTTLPTAIGITGRVYNIKNSGTGVITIATTSAQTIDGSTTAVLSVQYTSLNVQSNGANWIIL
jgi:Pectate lyase superfamily protein/Major tropism determinant N-terminal domain